MGDSWRLIESVCASLSFLSGGMFGFLYHPHMKNQTAVMSLLLDIMFSYCTHRRTEHILKSPFFFFNFVAANDASQKLDSKEVVCTVCISVSSTHICCRSCCAPDEKKKKKKLFSYMKRHIASRQLTVTKQAVAFVFLFFLGGRRGAFPSPVCLCTGSMGSFVRVPQRKKSTEGSCTCAAGWLSLDSALHITALAWMLDLTEVTSMPHHPHKTHGPTHKHAANRDGHIYTQQVPRWHIWRHNADSGKMLWCTCTHTKQLRDM